MSAGRGQTPLANPRVLIVTPEITYLPDGMGNMANRMRAKAGGLADVSASLVSALFELGADVHVALPHYRRMFHVDVGKLISEELRVYQSKLPDTRIHLAEDRAFYYRDEVYSAYGTDNTKIAIAFQREVINNIIPIVKPDLIHCNDWMTGIVPACARRLNIPCLLTLHNIHTYEVSLDRIEDLGIDAAEFWRHLYFVRQPVNYEETRESNSVDLLASGIFASHFINSVSPTFLEEVAAGRHAFVADHLRKEIAAKKEAGCATGILNAPDPQFDPNTDPLVARHYTSENHLHGKQENKRALQRELGLNECDSAPLFFWPSRLDPNQKGCQLLADILYSVVSDYWGQDLQVAVVANGAYQRHFHDIVRHHGFHGRVAVCDFDERLSHLGYAASDFVLIPSLFEPCGLPQMIGMIYGGLPVAHDTGGLHDTVVALDASAGTGNGFLFETYDPGGLRWAIDRAMDFHALAPEIRQAQTARIMQESRLRFSHAVTARAYIDIYESMLRRPLVDRHQNQG